MRGGKKHGFKNDKKMGAIFLACATGAIAVQLMAPVILAIFVNVASLMIPFMGYYLFIQKRWRIRLERIPEEEAETPQTKENEPVKKEPTAKEPCAGEEEIPADEDNETYAWYQEGGKERIDRMINSLYERGICECWIRKDGICNIRGFRGYRRVEILPGYPGNDADTIAVLLRENELQVENQGKHLHILWS